MEEKEEALSKIKEEVLYLVESPLYSDRVEHNYFPVIGEGNCAAQIMFVGEAPGENEAKTGRPFCGRAGKILDELLQSVGIERREVYITNIVKDRPPGNRDPLPEEISVYAPFLDREIEIIKPKVVATLGRFAMAYVMNRYGLKGKLAPISVLHGQSLQATNFKLLPLYHPAAAIYNQKLLSTLKEDIKSLVNIEGLWDNE